MHDKLFANQSNLNKEQFVAHAKDIGLDVPKFETCLEDPAAKATKSGSKDAVLRKVLGDLTQAGCDVDEASVRTALDEKAVEARRQLMSES